MGGGWVEPFAVFPLGHFSYLLKGVYKLGGSTSRRLCLGSPLRETRGGKECGELREISTQENN